MFQDTPDEISCNFHIALCVRDVDCDSRNRTDDTGHRDAIFPTSAGNHKQEPRNKCHETEKDPKKHWTLRRFNETGQKEI